MIFDNMSQKPIAQTEDPGLRRGFWDYEHPINLYRSFSVMNPSSLSRTSISLNLSPLNCLASDWLIFPSPFRSSCSKMPLMASAASSGVSYLHSQDITRVAKRHSNMLTNTTFIFDCLQLPN